MSLTHGTLLGGRIHYAQPAEGYRTGIEPVLLAASIPARPGERVLEAGTGAGAGLLCLAARVPAIAGMGIERDPAQAGLAAVNFAANGFEQLHAEQGDILAWHAGQVFDHAFANPPWHAPAGTPPTKPGRLSAKMSAPGLLASWARAIAACLRPGGTLSLILPAAHMAEAAGALAGAACAEITLVPFWPKTGLAAKIVILRGVREGRGACTLMAGIVLHDEKGRFTAQAEAILRHGAALHGRDGDLTAAARSTGAEDRISARNQARQGALPLDPIKGKPLKSLS